MVLLPPPFGGYGLGVVNGYKQLLRQLLAQMGVRPSQSSGKDNRWPHSPGAHEVHHINRDKNRIIGRKNC